jgi:ferredoxin
MDLKEAQDMVNRCNKCGLCIPSCPVYHKSQKHTLLSHNENLNTEGHVALKVLLEPNT